MSVLAIGFAGGAVLLTFLPAARNVAMGDLAPTRRSSLMTTRVLYYLLRGMFIFTRGVPELVWAMIIIFFLSPGILPGAIALGLHNYGILGKLSAEVVENLDPLPSRALRASGAGSFQMLAYSIIPQLRPQFITYLLYRWEVVIRTTIVVGFVSAGGLGRDFRLSMSYFPLYRRCPAADLVLAPGGCRRPALRPATPDGAVIVTISIYPQGISKVRSS